MKKAILFLLFAAFAACEAPEPEPAQKLVNVKFNIEEDIIKIAGTWYHNSDLDEGRLLQDVGVRNQVHERRLIIETANEVASVTPRGFDYDYKVYRLGPRMWSIESRKFVEYFAETDTIEFDLLMYMY